MLSTGATWNPLLAIARQITAKRWAPTPQSLSVSGQGLKVERPRIMRPRSATPLSARAENGTIIHQDNINPSRRLSLSPRARNTTCLRRHSRVSSTIIYRTPSMVCPWRPETARSSTNTTIPTSLAAQVLHLAITCYSVMLRIRGWTTSRSIWGICVAGTGSRDPVTG